jgi:hypothetical protein
MADDIAVVGTSASAPFSLKAQRGDGMVLLGMDWRDGPHPPDDFVGFSIQYRPPDHDRFFSLSRLSFARHPANVGTNPRSSPYGPIQKSAGSTSRSTRTCPERIATGSGPRS